MNKIKIDDILNRTFGHKKFKGSQQQIIEHLIDGQDALVIMATGAGKSLCYQLPGLVRVGVTVVVSPLIALMKEQVFELEQLGLNAVCVHSSLSWREVEELESQLLMGALDFLYLSPEKLLNEQMQVLLHRIDIALFAIDEAHCIWRWGEQFRPEYQQLSFLAEDFPRVPRVALTATAGENCRDEIVKTLAIGGAKIFEDEIDRKNIYYWVQPKKNAKDQLIKFLHARHANHCGIVYCQTRKKTEEFCSYLNQNKFSAGCYHAGISADERWQVQDAFLKGQLKIMVATVAFGMGINKPDIRFVAHVDLAKNLESYYQEVGRAGRDGLAADAWMLFGLRDFQQLSQWINNSEHDEQRKSWESSQLQDLLKFVIDSQCRRKNLLPSFGLQLNSDCLYCDNCGFPGRVAENSTAAAQALSAVFRCGQKFGIDYLIKVLRGKKIKSIESNRHEKLAVYAMGKEHSELYWRAVYFHLLLKGALTLHGEYCDLVKLTVNSKKFLNFKENFKFSRFHFYTDQDYHSQRIIEKTENEQLFKMLYACRQKLAGEHDILDYQVVSDLTLIELCETMPADDKALLKIEGFAIEKITRYGERFLAEIKQYLKDVALEVIELKNKFPKPATQNELEKYALENKITLHNLAKKLAQYIQLNLLNVEDILPINKAELEKLQLQWPCSHHGAGYAEARKLLNENDRIKLHHCWLPCLKATFGEQRYTT